jgi:hypothetical protein
MGGRCDQQNHSAEERDLETRKIAKPHPPTRGVPLGQGSRDDEHCSHHVQ